MATVPLTFIPPERSGFTTLEIYEAADPSATVGTLIDSLSVTEPYPTNYTTPHANNATDYFAIRWLNADGSATEFSEWVKGGTSTLVGIIVQRMLLRDPSLNENIAAQEAEAAISNYFGVIDPTTVDPTTVSPTILSGLTFLALAWTYIAQTSISSQGQKWVAGIVSFDAGASSQTRAASSPDDLLKLANKLLGTTYSIMMQLPEINFNTAYHRLTTVDLSRTMIEI